MGVDRRPWREDLQGLGVRSLISAFSPATRRGFFFFGETRPAAAEARHLERRSACLYLSDRVLITGADGSARHLRCQGSGGGWVAGCASAHRHPPPLFLVTYS